MDISLRYNTPFHPIVLKEQNDVPFFVFPLLEDTGLVKHGFSTRLGGVSQGYFSTMNLTFTTGDSGDAVLENYRRLGGAMGIRPEDMVLSYQTHTTNIRRVTKEDRGKGITRERDYRDVDGLITDVPGIALVTFYADCVPLYFLDPVRRAIGLSHSGWRGTVERMGAKTIAAMGEAFGSRPEDILACIGPSICKGCYEVSEDVAEQFLNAFPKEAHGCILEKGAAPGKYQLDLWSANQWVLLDAGIRMEHLAVTNVCTCCNPEVLFSHRASKGKRGNLGAFLELL